MRKLFASLAVLLAPLSLALTPSPAQDLFDQASFYIEFYYNGPSTLDLKGLSAKYQAQLDTACAADKDKCAFEKAVPLIESMIEELQDNHTYYQSPEDLGRTQAGRQGTQRSTVLRIGLTHRAIEGSRDRLVMDVVENGPAFEAGIQYGDRITAVNGRSLSELASDEAVVQFLNQQVQSGNPVTLSITRGTAREKIELRLTGKDIALARFPSIRYLANNVAVLKIPEFFPQGQVGVRVHQLVAEAQRRNARGIILELRGNPGGSALDALIAMAAFVDNPSVTFRDRYATQSTTYLIRGQQAVIQNAEGTVLNRLPIQGFARWNGPVVVLVDRGSASGAEYLASALQRVGVKVIGEATTGIGNTTTQTFNLINGGGINISYNRAFFADGSSYVAQVRPDIAGSLDIAVLANQGRDNVIDQALQTMGVAATLPNSFDFGAYLRPNYSLAFAR